MKFLEEDAIIKWYNNLESIDLFLEFRIQKNVTMMMTLFNVDIMFFKQNSENRGTDLSMMRLHWNNNLNHRFVYQFLSQNNAGINSSTDKIKLGQQVNQHK